MSLNLISTAPSGQVVDRELEGRILSGPTLSPLLVWLVARLMLVLSNRGE